MSALCKVFAGTGLAALATTGALVTGAPANASIIVHDGTCSAAGDGVIIQGLVPTTRGGIIINDGTGCSEQQLFPPGPV
jgi:hypothetical protein